MKNDKITDQEAKRMTEERNKNILKAWRGNRIDIYKKRYPNYDLIEILSLKEVYELRDNTRLLIELHDLKIMNVFKTIILKDEYEKLWIDGRVVMEDTLRALNNEIIKRNSLRKKS